MVSRGSDKLKKYDVLPAYLGQKYQNIPVVSRENYSKGRRISLIRDGHLHDPNPKDVFNYSYGQ